MRHAAGDEPQPERTGAIVVAAGEGGGKDAFDRIFADLAGKPVLAHSVGVFEACPEITDVVIVTHGANLDRAWRLATDEAWRKVGQIVPGGQRRQDSVLAGLQALAGCAWVLIHDGARPLVTAGQIAACLAAARSTGAALLAVPAREAIKMVNVEKMVRGTPDRTTLWLAQTPQAFRYNLIVQAYRDAFGDVFDDSVLIERQNLPVRVVLGSYDNIKISIPEDLECARALLRHRQSSPQGEGSKSR